MLDENSTSAYLLLGDIHFDSGKLNKAIERWEQIIQKGLHFAFLAYRRLENAYLQQGQYDKIGNIYRQKLKDNPTDVRTHLALAKYYQKSGRIEQAIDEGEKALRYNPHLPEVRQFVMHALLENKGQDIINEHSSLFQDIRIEDITLHCSQCGYEDLNSPWKCARCREWDTFIDPLSGEQPTTS